MREIAYKVMPNGNIRGYRPDREDKAGASESQFLNPRGISSTITCAWTPKIILRDMKRYRIRKLTPKECFRLMGVSDADIDKMQSAGISDTQLYKMAGNSIVVDVLAGIFTQMFAVDYDGWQSHYRTL